MVRERFTELSKVPNEREDERHTEAGRMCANIEQEIRRKRVEWLNTNIHRAYSGGPDDAERVRHWESILDVLPDVPLRFLEHMLRAILHPDSSPWASNDDFDYWVRQKLDELYAQLEASGFTRARGNFSINKTGSKLDAKVFGRRTVFINTVSRKARNAWVSAASIVPVSPIFRELPSESGDVKVVTRYCGQSIGDITDVTTALLSGRQSDTVETVVIELMKNVDEQRTAIAKSLFESGISHGHMHNGNFTVEFVRKRYLASTTRRPITKADGVWSLPAGKILNAVPYNEHEFTFVLSHYFDEPDEWVPIVRLIDFDSAIVHSPRPSFKQWVAEDPHAEGSWRMEELPAPHGAARVADAARGVVRRVVTALTFGRAADGGVRLTIETDPSPKEKRK